jgi:hypothetical protein
MVKSIVDSEVTERQLGRLAACGGLFTRVVDYTKRRLTTGAQLTKLPHKKT